MNMIQLPGGGHTGNEIHHHYIQDIAPVSIEAGGSDPLQVGDLWSDTTANLFKRCTAINPDAFVSIEGGTVAHDYNASIHAGTYKVEVPISAASMKGTTTNGAGDTDQLPESSESSTNKVNTDFIAFDTTTEENAFFIWTIPKGWDGGTITFIYKWTNTGGSSAQTVTIGVKAISLADNDAIDTAFGTEVTLADTFLAQNDVHVSAESNAVTIGGSPTAGDLVCFNVARKTGSDNLSGDMRLMELILIYTRDTIDDD